MLRGNARSKLAVGPWAWVWSLALALAPSLACASPGQQPSAPSNPKTPRSYSITLPPKPDFSALDWLIGEWAGKTLGKGAAGDVHLDAAYALDRQYLIINEWIVLPATKTAPATRESWMNIISVDASASGFVLQSYSSTGFVLRYRVAAQANRIEFFPDGGERAPTGWLFRRTLTRIAEDAIAENVRVAPPDGPFFEYYSARLTRVAATPAAAQPAAPASPNPAAPAPSAAAPSAQPPNKEKRTPPRR